MLFIDHIVDECVSNEILLFMDGFSGYNQITIHPKDQHPLFVLGAHLHTRRCLLALKMLELLFSGPCLMLSTTSNMLLKHTWMT